MENNENMCCCLTDDREILKAEIMKLLDDIPIERVKSLYIRFLAAKTPLNGGRNDDKFGGAW